MEIESAKCECCGLKEDCTQDYINEVKGKFEGKWLCGLCAEAVRDEVIRSSSSSSSGGKKKQQSSCILMDDAMKAHMSFCRKFKSNPAIRVSDGMRQMLIRRRSGELSTSSSPNTTPTTTTTTTSKKYMRSASSTSQVSRDGSSFPLY